MSKSRNFYLKKKKNEKNTKFILLKLKYETILNKIFVITYLNN